MTTATDARGLLRECRDAMQAEVDNCSEPWDDLKPIIAKIDAFLTAAPVGVPKEPTTYSVSHIKGLLVSKEDYDTLRTALAAARSEALEEAAKEYDQQSADQPVPTGLRNIGTY